MGTTRWMLKPTRCLRCPSLIHLTVFFCFMLLLPVPNGSFSLGEDLNQDDICDNMQPVHGNATRRSKKEIQIIPDKKYFSPNGRITFTVQFKRNIYVKGIMMQVRSTRTNMPVGRIINNYSNDLTYIHCFGKENSTLVHKHALAPNIFKMILFTWIAPDTSVGGVYLFATIVENIDTFWSRNSPNVREKRLKLSTSTDQMTMTQVIDPFTSDGRPTNLLTNAPSIMYSTSKEHVHGSTETRFTEDITEKQTRMEATAFSHTSKEDRTSDTFSTEGMPLITETVTLPTIPYFLYNFTDSTEASHNATRTTRAYKLTRKRPKTKTYEPTQQTEVFTQTQGENRTPRLTTNTEETTRVLPTENPSNVVTDNMYEMITVNKMVDNSEATTLHGEMVQNTLDYGVTSNTYELASSTKVSSTSNRSDLVTDNMYAITTMKETFNISDGTTLHDEMVQNTTNNGGITINEELDPSTSVTSSKSDDLYTFHTHHQTSSDVLVSADTDLPFWMETFTPSQTQKRATTKTTSESIISNAPVDYTNIVSSEFTPVATQTSLQKSTLMQGLLTELLSSTESLKTEPIRTRTPMLTLGSTNSLETMFYTKSSPQSTSESSSHITTIPLTHKLAASTEMSEIGVTTENEEVLTSMYETKLVSTNNEVSSLSSDLTTLPNLPEDMFSTQETVSTGNVFQKTTTLSYISYLSTLKELATRSTDFASLIPTEIVTDAKNGETNSTRTVIPDTTEKQNTESDSTETFPSWHGDMGNFTEDAITTMLNLAQSAIQSTMFDKFPTSSVDSTTIEMLPSILPTLPPSPMLTSRVEITQIGSKISTNQPPGTDFPPEISTGIHMTTKYKADSTTSTTMSQIIPTTPLKVQHFTDSTTAHVSAIKTQTTPMITFPFFTNLLSSQGPTSPVHQLTTLSVTSTSTSTTNGYTTPSTDTPKPITTLKDEVSVLPVTTGKAITEDFSTIQISTSSQIVESTSTSSTITDGMAELPSTHNLRSTVFYPTSSLKNTYLPPSNIPVATSNEVTAMFFSDSRDTTAPSVTISTLPETLQPTDRLLTASFQPSTSTKSTQASLQTTIYNKNEDSTVSHETTTVYYDMPTSARILAPTTPPTDSNIFSSPFTIGTTLRPEKSSSVFVSMTTSLIQTTHSVLNGEVTPQPTTMTLSMNPPAITTDLKHFDPGTTTETAKQTSLRHSTNDIGNFLTTSSPIQQYSSTFSPNVPVVSDSITPGKDMMTPTKTESDETVSKNMQAAPFTSETVSREEATLSPTTIVRIRIRISNLIFQKELEDPNSSEFADLSKEIVTLLWGAFNTSDELEDIQVEQFAEGSIFAEAALYFIGEIGNIEELLKLLVPGNNGDFNISEVAAKNDNNKWVDSVCFVKPCLAELNCATEMTTCVSTCDNNPNYCKNSRRCEEVNDFVRCRCDPGYSGERCEISVSTVEPPTSPQTGTTKKNELTTLKMQTPAITSFPIVTSPKASVTIKPTTAPSQSIVSTLLIVFAGFGAILLIVVFLLLLIMYKLTLGQHPQKGKQLSNSTRPTFRHYSVSSSGAPLVQIIDRSDDESSNSSFREDIPRPKGINSFMMEGGAKNPLPDLLSFGGGPVQEYEMDIFHPTNPKKLRKSVSFSDICFVLETNDTRSIENFTFGKENVFITQQPKSENVQFRWNYEFPLNSDEASV